MEGGMKQGKPLRFRRFLFVAWTIAVGFFIDWGLREALAAEEFIVGVGIGFSVIVVVAAYLFCLVASVRWF